MQEMQRIVAQEDDQAPIDPCRQVQEIRDERRQSIRVVDGRHQDVLHNVEQNIRWEECSYRDVKAVPKFKSISASCATGRIKETLLSPTTW